jgi:hypothetical protein
MLSSSSDIVGASFLWYFLFFPTNFYEEGFFLKISGYFSTFNTYCDDLWSITLLLVAVKLSDDMFDRVRFGIFAWLWGIF